MCGIAGFTPILGNKDTSIDVIRKMLVQLKHRGPDERGVYFDQSGVLGHVRLSIIDLETGQQPMSDEDGILWITFNGEIFNYIELKEELVSKGYRFRTKSDTEVLLNLFKAYGAEGLKKLNGQFAFAIWNSVKKELFLARDRVGIRPIYYTRTGASFVFASEIKALLQFPGVEAKLSHQSLCQIFTLWTTLSPSTAFENIYEVPPGHYMIVNGQDQLVRPFWQLTFPENGMETGKTLDENIEEFDALFKDAVRIRLRADVPVGAYLSGGIDSSVTTATINEIFPKILRTFSIGFSESEFDESHYQRMIIDYLNVDNAGVYCTSEDIARVFSDVVRHTEMPLLRTAPAPMYLLSRHVHNHGYKVVITGEGADEMLTGYNIFKEARIRRFWAKEPNSKIRPLLLNKLYPYLGQMNGMNNNALKLFFGYSLSSTNSPLYSHLLRWHNTSRIRQYLNEDVRNAYKDYNPLDQVYEMLPENFTSWNHLSQGQWLETNIFMSNYLLSSQGDRVAMANSVEGRYPFLDHRVIEFCTGINPDHKLKGLNEKYLLKKTMRGRLPDEILERPKQAYRAPIRTAFLSNTDDRYQHLISDSKVDEAGIFDKSNTNKLWNNLLSGRKSSEVDNMAITAIISTHLLHDQFVRKQPEVQESDGAFPVRIIDGQTVKAD